MANESIERTVDDLIRKGRISESLRGEYTAILEANLSNDLLRGADYTRKTQQLAAERREAEGRLRGEFEKLQAEKARLMEWQGQVQNDLNEYNRVVRDLPSLTAKAAAYEQALKDYGVLDAVTVPPVRPAEPQIPKMPTTPTKTAEEPKGDSMTREEAAGVFRDFIALNGKVARIQNQHRRLFGEELDDDLISHYFSTGQDPEEHWRVKYAVENKKAEIANRDREAERAKIREEERAKLMQEYAVDPSRVPGGQAFPRPGGLSPLLEAYGNSRALAHSQTTPNETPLQKPGEHVPPEMRPELAAQRERINAASRMFMEHFDPSGVPTTDQGKKLYQKHFVSDQGW